MNKTKAVKYNLFFGYLYAIFNAVTGIILLPLYFHYFSIEVYGSWLACNGIATLFAVLEGGVSMIVTQRLAECLAEEDKEKFSNILGSTIVLSTVFAILFFIGGLILLFAFSHSLNIPPAYRTLIIEAVILNLAGKGITFIFLALGAVPQVFLETISSGMISAVAYVVNIVTIIVALYFGGTIVALGLGSLAFALTNLFGFIFYLVHKRINKRLMPINYSWSTIRVLFKESKSVIIANSTGIIGANLEPTIAAYFISPGATAILAINSKVFQVAQMFLDRIGTSVFASLSLYIKSKNVKEVLVTLNKLLGISIVMSIIIYGLSVVFSKEIITIWLGENKFGGQFLICVLGVSALINSRKELLSNISYAYGFITKTSKFLVYSSIMRIIFYLFLPRYFGLAGIPLAGILGSFLVVYLISNYFAIYLKLKAAENIFFNSGITTSAILTLSLVVLYFLKYNHISLIATIIQSVLFFAVIIVIFFLVDRKLVLYIKKSVIKNTN